MKPVLLDIMHNGTFLCQLRYTKRGYPKMVNGQMTEVHRVDDLKEFVLSQRPSLRGKDITIIPSNQRIFP